MDVKIFGLTNPDFNKADGKKVADMLSKYLTKHGYLFNAILVQNNDEAGKDDNDE